MSNKCEICGKDKVLNPKTGKMFCPEKCWLKRPASTPNPYVPPENKGWAKSLGQETPTEDKIKIATEMMLKLDDIQARVKGLEIGMDELIKTNRGE